MFSPGRRGLTDSMKKKEALLAWQAIRENNRYISRFLTTSEFYRNVIVKRFPEIKDQTSVVYPGVNQNQIIHPLPDVPVIGYFNRMNKAGGDWYSLLKPLSSWRKKNSIPKLRPNIGGGSTGIDKAFILKQKQMLAPWKDSNGLWREIWSGQSCGFLQFHYGSFCSHHVRWVRGTFIFGILAAGRPARTIVGLFFREIVGDGAIYEPNNSDKLAEALERIWQINSFFQQLPCWCTSLLFHVYSDTAQAEKMIRIYNNIINKEDSIVFFPLFVLANILSLDVPINLPANRQQKLLIQVLSVVRCRNNSVGAVLTAMASIMKRGLLKKWPASGPELLWEASDLGKGFQVRSLWVIVFISPATHKTRRRRFSWPIRSTASSFTRKSMAILDQSQRSWCTNHSWLLSAIRLLRRQGWKREIVCLNTADGSIVWKLKAQLLAMRLRDGANGWIAIGLWWKGYLHSRVERKQRWGFDANGQDRMAKSVYQAEERLCFSDIDQQYG